MIQSFPVFKKSIDLVPEAAIVLIALIFRLPLLGGSFWLDEAAQALESARPLSEQLNIIPDFQPPLLHLILHFAMYFSQAEWWLRTVGALVPGLITIWATYRIGKKLVGKYVGATASLLLATNSFHIFYSQELRPYSLPAMLATLSWLLLISWHQLRPRTSLLLFSFLTALGLYSSYLYPFVVLAQLLYILLFHKKLRKMVITSVSLGALAFVPWIPTFLRQLEEGQFVRQALPGWENVVSLPQLKALPLTLGKFIYGVVDLELNLMFLLPTALISGLLFSLLAFSFYSRRAETVRYLKIFAVWLFVPLLLSWLVSFAVPVVRPKRLLFLMPPLYLLTSAVVIPFLSKGATSLKGGIAVLFILVLGLINLGGTYQYFSSPKLQRENWRHLYIQITSSFPARSVVAVYSFPEPFAPMRWYDTEDLPSISTGELSVDRVENLPERLKAATDYQYVLYFDYLSDLTDPNRKVLATLQEFGYHEVTQLDYPNIGFVRVLTKMENITAQAGE